DLVLGRRQAALHMRQRDVGDGGVQRLHDGRQHDRDGDQPRMGLALRCFSGNDTHGAAYCAGACAGSSHASAWLSTVNRPRRWPVSISTTALMPARSVVSAGRSITCRRTGMRCTTLTQLPLAFCAGSTLNSAPVAMPMLSTTAVKVRPG